HVTQLLKKCSQEDSSENCRRFGVSFRKSANKLSNFCKYVFELCANTGSSTTHTVSQFKDNCFSTHHSNITLLWIFLEVCAQFILQTRKYIQGVGQMFCKKISLKSELSKF